MPVLDLQTLPLELPPILSPWRLATSCWCYMCLSLLLFTSVVENCGKGIGICGQFCQLNPSCCEVAMGWWLLVAYGVKLENCWRGLGMAFGLLMISSCSFSCCARRLCRYLRKSLEIWNRNPLYKMFENKHFHLAWYLHFELKIVHLTRSLALQFATPWNPNFSFRMLFAAFCLPTCWICQPFCCSLVLRHC